LSLRINNLDDFDRLVTGIRLVSTWVGAAVEFRRRAGAGAAHA